MPVNIGITRRETPNTYRWFRSILKVDIYLESFTSTFFISSENVKKCTLRIKEAILYYGFLYSSNVYRTAKECVFELNTS